MQINYGDKLTIKRTPGLPLKTRVVAKGTINRLTGQPFTVTVDVDLSYGRGAQPTTFVVTEFGPIALSHVESVQAA